MKDVAIFISTRNVADTLSKVLDRIPDDIKNQVGEIFYQISEYHVPDYYSGIRWMTLLLILYGYYMFQRFLKKIFHTIYLRNSIFYHSFILY